MEHNITLLSENDVKTLLSYKDLLGPLERGFSNFSLGKEGGVLQPVRTVIPVAAHNGLLYTMPAYSAADEAMACKMLTFFPNNKDVPSHQARVLYFDPTNGQLLCIMGAEELTVARTAMSSAVATKHLANPAARILAIVGSGAEARSHYKAMTLLQSFDEVRVCSRTFDNAKAFATEFGAKACETVEEAVRDADIICTVTSSRTPLVKAEWVKPGAHINAVGSAQADIAELEADLVRSSVVYCDSKEACLKEAGDIILAKAEIFGEIGEVILGRKEAQWQKTTIFKSVGMAVEDVIAAKLVYEAYRKSKTH